METPEQSSPGPSRKHKRPFTRSHNLTLALTPRRADTSSIASPSPQRLPPDFPTPSFSVQSASTTSPDRSTTCSVDPYRLTPSSPEFIRPRSVSAQTIRGPEQQPLTPFPPWVDEEDGDEEAKRVKEERRRRMLGVVMDGVVLGVQMVVALGVFSVLAWVTLWKKGDSDAEFWEWLWKYAEPCIAFVIILCGGGLLVHEVRVLSSVAMLYLHSAILVFATITSVVLWGRCFEEESRAVKGVLMGCNIFLWGLSFFGFVRSVVLWRVEADEEGLGAALRGHGNIAYGTFSSWMGHRDGDASRRANYDRV